jgi:uncharacterized membrane protein YphA (DoxX/SURF4 family)
VSVKFFTRDSNGNSPINYRENEKVGLSTDTFIGTPDRIRTYDLRLRKPTLYPAELRVLNATGVILACYKRESQPRGTANSDTLSVIMRKQVQKQNVPSLLLRIGLAFVFAYAAISSFQEPAAWVSFVPGFVTHFIQAKTFLDLFAVLELLLATALLAGKFVKYAAALAALSLVGLLVFNLNSLIVTFRDVGLTFMAAALFFLEK